MIFRVVLPAILLVAAATVRPLAAQGAPPMPRRGILVSEVHNGPGPLGPVRYVEIMNLFLGTPATGLDLGGGMLKIETATGPLGGASATFTFPPGTLLPGPGPAGGYTFFVIASAPTGADPAREILAPGFFQNVPAMLMPGTTTRVTVGFPPNATHPEHYDEVVVGPPGPLPTSNPPQGFEAFLPSISPVVANGHVNRALFTQSSTEYDYETVTGQLSPGLRNPTLDSVNGFQWDQGPAVQGFPILVTALAGAVSMVNVPVTGVRVDHHPEYGPVITDPAYDEVLQSGVVNATMQVQGTNQFLANAAAPQGLVWSLTVPLSPGMFNPSVDGILNSNHVSLGQVYANYFTNFQAPGLVPGAEPIRIERVLADDSGTDGMTSGTGALSKVQIDVLPENAGNDLWCEIIIYDLGGNAYKAKVRNWPPNPQSCAGNPTLSLFSTGSGDMDLVALCFPAGTEIYVLPSVSPASPTGSGPFFGINFDALTLLALLSPLPTPPLHVFTNDDGLYFFGFPTGTFPTGFGLTLDAVAVERLPTGGAGDVSSVATITF